MASGVRLGIIGLSEQVREHYLPYLEHRINERGDLVITWISGYLPDHSGFAAPYEARYLCKPGEAWQEMDPVDGVVVSIPNALHGRAIRESFRRGACVAVDKPPTISPEECAELVDLAEQKGLVFVALSQRRYEEIYQSMARIIEDGELGLPELIHYMICHMNFDPEGKRWRSIKSLAGGGALMDLGYHGIDTVLWLLSLGGSPVEAASISARCCPKGREEAVESIAVARIGLDNGGIFDVIASDVIASKENPVDSVDECLKIYGTLGAIRMTRLFLSRTPGDMRAGTLSFQRRDGNVKEFDTSGWSAKRWGPMKDFVDAVICRKGKQKWSVVSPARDGIPTLQVIEGAYKSDEGDGQEIPLCPIRK